MLGGGTFTAQDRVIPGAYINFVSAAQTGVDISGRGIVAIPLALSWGKEHTVQKITAEEFRRDCLEIFGYPMESREMLPFRELFKNAVTVYYYRLNNEAIKSSNNLGEARYGGVRGNAIRLVVQKNVDDETKYDVKTYLDTAICDRQTVAAASELKDNEFVIFKKDAELEETAGMEMVGGSDGGPANGEAYQEFLDKIQSCQFHVLACDTTDVSTKSLFTAFTNRMRDDMGVKFQTVLYRADAGIRIGLLDSRRSGRMRSECLKYEPTVQRRVCGGYHLQAGPAGGRDQGREVSVSSGGRSCPGAL